MRHRRFLLAAASVVLAACTTTEPVTTTSTEPSTTSSSTQSVTAEHHVVVYLLADPAVGDHGPYLVPVHRTWVGETGEGCAVEALLAGYTFSEVDLGLGSAVPVETQLLGVQIEGSTAIVDLSRGFESGGGTSSMLGRLGQLVFTATRVSNADQVILQMDGERVTVFSREGLEIREPLTRSDFGELLSPVHIEFPAWEEVVGFPVTVRGSADLPMGMFRWTLVDWDGLILSEGVVDVPGSSTKRQPFETQIWADVSAVMADRGRPFDGTLIVDAAGPGDTDQTIIEIPLRFAELR